MYNKSKNIHHENGERATTWEKKEKKVFRVK